MASELDDLNFEIKGDISGTMDRLKTLGNQLDQIIQTADLIDASFRNMAASAGLPVKEVDLLLLRMQPLMNTLDKADKQANALEESFTRKLMARALEDHTKKVVLLSDGTQRARFEMIKLAEASQQLRIPTQTQTQRPSSGGTGQSGGGVNFVRVTAAAAQLTMMARVSSTMKTVGQSVAQVGRTSDITASAMTRFRMGLQAVPVNPALNVVKTGLDSIGSAAGRTIDTLRGVADSILSDLPGAASAAVGAMGSVNVSLDSVSATASKHVSKLQQMQGSLTLLSNVFPFAADAIAKFRGPLDVVTSKAEQVANRIDGMNASVGTAAAEMRGKAYVMTGAWTQLAGSADIFSRAQYYALLPTRLLFREFEGGQRIVKVATHAYAMLTHPIHAVALALGQSRAEWQNLRARLPPLTGGLQLATRANRAFAQSAYVVGSAARGVVAVLNPLAKLTLAGGRGLMSLISPAKSAAASLAKLTGVQNTFIGRALGMKQSADVAAGSLSKMGSSSAGLSGMFGGITGKAVMLAAGVTALVTGAMAWGASTAIAGEKNDVVFGTMLKSMSQGKAVVDSLQATDAAKLFDNDELLTSGRLLFKAGVSAADLAGKTNQLATIATATSTDLNDLARVYQQGAVTGSFGQDKINQLAERGIDIYHGLEASTGKSGGALKKMISDGKIGLTEMDGALAHLTEGNGIYAGALQNVAGTAGGMMSQMKNNTQQALGQLMGYGLSVFRPILAAGVAFTGGLKVAIIALEPVFTQSMGIISAVMSTAWTAISDVATGAFSLIFGDSALTFDSVITWMASMLGAATFIFANIGTFADYAWTTMKLGAAMAFNDIIYFFTDTIPAYLGWFSENWANVFLDAGNLIVTVFANIGKNIGSAMMAIWDFIASGGTAKLEFAFVPLLDGFKSTVSELPNVPERAMTELEQQLTVDLGQMGADLGTGLTAAMTAAVDSVGTQTATTLDTAKPKTESGEDTAAKKANKPVENKAVLVRSSEGQSVVAQMAKAFGKGDREKKAQDAQIQSAKDLKDIAREVRRGSPLVAKAW